MTSWYRVRPAADADLDDQAAYLAREASLDLPEHLERYVHDQVVAGRFRAKMT